MFFLLFFLFNLLSNLFYFGEHVFQGWIYVLFPLLSIVSLSAFIAVAEIWLLKGIRRLFGKGFESFCFLLLVGIHLCLILCDSFLLYKFGWILNQESLYIVAETNKEEIEAFFCTYVSSEMLLVLGLVFTAGMYFAWKLSNQKVLSSIPSVFRAISFLGVCIMMYGVYSFLMFGNGCGIPQYTALTRCFYGCFSLHQHQMQIRQLESACLDVHASFSAECDTLPHIVVVIGESSSWYHCSLYNYNKPTWPRMATRAGADEIIVFEQATSAYDATNGAMRSILSVSSDHFGLVPLFPSVFRGVGYRTALYENEYFLGNGISFLCDKGVSDAVFDKRVDGPFRYDEQMIDSLTVADTLSLDIVHLVGQHFDYIDRYPPGFSKFLPEDYDSQQYSFKQREVIAQYDNSAFYCDYVIDQIIQKYESEDCLLFFFSDHGEEMFEQRDYRGHCSAATAPDPSYLYRIPFFVWTSALFKEKHPNVVQVINTDGHNDFCTSGFSSWLMCLIGIDYDTQFEK